MTPGGQDAQVQDLEALVRARTGMAPRRGPSGAFAAAVRRAMRSVRCSDLATFARDVHTHESVLQSLIDHVVVGETYFMRHPAAFQAIAERVLPDLMRHRPDTYVIRAWSAGCSTGEEAYSLAMLFQQHGLANRSRVSGTDISQRALGLARTARYRTWSLRGASQTLLDRYFTEHGGLFHLDSAIAHAVRFSQLNLTHGDYPSTETATTDLDLVLCRNVLIYYDSDMIAVIGRRLLASLAPGGWLVLGPSDPALPHGSEFEAIATPGGLFYRCLKGGVAPVTPVPVAHALPAPPAVAPTSPPAPTPPPTLHAPPPKVVLPPSPPRDPLVEAQTALAMGDYARVLRVGRTLPQLEEAWLMMVRAAGNLSGPEEAAVMCADGLREQPLSLELHYIHAVLLMELRRDESALKAINKVLYLDGDLAMPHFVQGELLLRVGDDAGAARSYRNARDISSGADPDFPLRFGDGMCAGRLAELAAMRLQALNGAGA